MSSFGEVPLKKVLEMLDACAPGYTKKAREHNIVIYYGQHEYPSLPLGKHGKREDPGVQVGHLKNMVKALDLDTDCVRQHLPQLQLKPKSK